MKLLIVSHANHYKKADQLLAYAPYVREINIWLKHADTAEIVAPIADDFDERINLQYNHNALKITPVTAFSLLSFKEILSTLIKLPGIIIILFQAMKRADHIHLRCPGNLGLLGCLVQILFPFKPKTAKYAGNWDPKSKQPWSYNLQKWILSNTFLTKNMTVLVYGHWPKQTKNIKPFFTASYHKSEIEELYIRNYSKTLHFCFVGSLSKGKQPEQALKFVQNLREHGTDAILHIYGDGELKKQLRHEIKEKKAENWAFMYGNQPGTQIKKALKYSHFLILPSKSEGWPKVVAEAMFWGCIPIASDVSCVPYMLDYGKRGFLLKKEDIDNTFKNFSNIQENPKRLELMSRNAAEWSRQYTLDYFESEISKIITK